VKEGSVKSRVVYFNGTLVPESEARVSIYDSALMFGDVAFEMTRSFGRRHFKLTEHLERLMASIKWLGIPFSMDIAELEQCCHDVAAANAPLFEADDEHRLMIDVTRGLLGTYADRVDVNTGPNLIIADFPLRWTVQDAARLYTEGIDIVIPSQRMIPAWLLEPKAKNRNRIHYLRANMEVSRHGPNAWALLIDPDGFLTEGTGANVFLVKNGTLLTPEPRNVLRGISRDYVMSLAAEMGIPVAERNLEPYDLMTADEAFFTCTPFCMVPAVTFQGEHIGSGTVGPLFTALITRWSEQVGVDIIGQIQGWGAQAATRPADGTTPYQFRSGLRRGA
jgi:branched-chain amino acid aminotransferase